MSINSRDLNRLLGRSLIRNGSNSDQESPTLRALADRVSQSRTTRDLYERAIARQAQQDRLFDTAFKQQLKVQEEQRQAAEAAEKRNQAIQQVADQRYEAAVQRVTGGDETARELMASNGTLNDAVNKQLSAELATRSSEDQFDKDGNLTADYEALLRAQEGAKSGVQFDVENFHGGDQNALNEAQERTQRNLNAGGLRNFAQSTAAEGVRQIGGLIGQVGEATIGRGAGLASRANQFADDINIVTPDEIRFQQQLAEAREGDSVFGDSLATVLNNPGAAFQTFGPGVAASVGVGGPGGALVRGGARALGRQGIARQAAARGAADPQLAARRLQSQQAARANRTRNDGVAAGNRPQSTFLESTGAVAPAVFLGGGGEFASAVDGAEDIQALARGGLATSAGATVLGGVAGRLGLGTLDAPLAQGRRAARATPGSIARAQRAPASGALASAGRLAGTTGRGVRAVGGGAVGEGGTEFFEGFGQDLAGQLGDGRGFSEFDFDSARRSGAQGAAAGVALGGSASTFSSGISAIGQRANSKKIADSRVRALTAGSADPLGSAATDDGGATAAITTTAGPPSGPGVGSATVSGGTSGGSSVTSGSAGVSSSPVAGGTAATSSGTTASAPVTGSSSTTGPTGVSPTSAPNTPVNPPAVETSKLSEPNAKDTANDYISLDTPTEERVLFVKNLMRENGLDPNLAGEAEAENIALEYRQLGSNAGTQDFRDVINRNLGTQISINEIGEATPASTITVNGTAVSPSNTAALEAQTSSADLTQNQDARVSAEALEAVNASQTPSGASGGRQVGETRFDVQGQGQLDIDQDRDAQGIIRSGPVEQPRVNTPTRSQTQSVNPAQQELDLRSGGEQSAPAGFDADGQGQLDIGDNRQGTIQQSRVNVPQQRQTNTAQQELDFDGPVNATPLAAAAPEAQATTLDDGTVGDAVDSQTPTQFNAEGQGQLDIGDDRQGTIQQPRINTPLIPEGDDAQQSLDFDAPTNTQPPEEVGTLVSGQQRRAEQLQQEREEAARTGDSTVVNEDGTVVNEDGTRSIQAVDEIVAEVVPQEYIPNRSAQLLSQSPTLGKQNADRIAALEDRIIQMLDDPGNPFDLQELATEIDTTAEGRLQKIEEAANLITIHNPAIAVEINKATLEMQQIFSQAREVPVVDPDPLISNDAADAGALEAEALSNDLSDFQQVADDTIVPYRYQNDPDHVGFPKPLRRLLNNAFSSTVTGVRDADTLSKQQVQSGEPNADVAPRLRFEHLAGLEGRTTQQKIRALKKFRSDIKKDVYEPLAKVYRFGVADLGDGPGTRRVPLRKDASPNVEVRVRDAMIRLQGQLTPEGQQLIFGKKSVGPARARVASYADLKSQVAAIDGPVLTPIQVVDAARKAVGAGLSNLAVQTFDGTTNLTAELRTQLRSNGIDVTESLDGFVANNTLYVNTNNVKTEAEVQLLTAHEVLGHVGLRARYGPQLNQVLSRIFTRVGGINNLQQLGESVGVSLRDQYPTLYERASTGDAQAQRTLVEEVISTAAENPDNTSSTLATAIRDFGASVRAFLSRIPLIGRLFGGFTNNDLLRVVRESANAARSAESVDLTGQQAFARNSLGQGVLAAGGPKEGTLTAFTPKGAVAALAPVRTGVDKAGIKGLGDTTPLVIDDTGKALRTKGEAVTRDVVTSALGVVKDLGTLEGITRKASESNRRGDVTRRGGLLNDLVTNFADHTDPIRRQAKATMRDLFDDVGVTKIVQGIYKNLSSSLSAFATAPPKQFKKDGTETKAYTRYKQRMATTARAQKNLVDHLSSYLGKLRPSQLADRMNLHDRLTLSNSVAGEATRDQLAPLNEKMNAVLAGVAKHLNADVAAAEKSANSVISAVLALEYNEAAFLKNSNVTDAGQALRDALLADLEAREARGTLSDAEYARVRDRLQEIAENHFESVDGLTYEEHFDSFAVTGYSTGGAKTFLAEVGVGPGALGIYQPVVDVMKQMQQVSNNATGFMQSQAVRNEQRLFNFQYGLPVKSTLDTQQTDYPLAVFTKEPEGFADANHEDEFASQYKGEPIADAYAQAFMGLQRQQFNNEVMESLMLNVLATETDPEFADYQNEFYRAQDIEVVPLDSKEYNNFIQQPSRSKFTHVLPGGKTAVIMTFDKDSPIPNAIRGIPSKSADIARKSRLLRASRSGVSGMSQMMTRMNANFLPRAHVREFITSAFLITADEGLTGLRNYVGKAINANGRMPSMYKYMQLRLRNTTDSRKAMREMEKSDPFLREFGEFVRLGGLVTVQQAFEDPGRNLSAQGAKGLTAKSYQQLDLWMGNVSDTTDALVRFSAYQAQLDLGRSKQQAAVYAKRMANFEARGKYSGPLSSLFMFYNPAAIGAARTLESLREGEYAKPALIAAVGAGITANFLLSMLSPKDDQGENLFDRESMGRQVTDLRIHLSENQTLSIPAGFSVMSMAFLMGNQLGSFMRGQQDMGEMAGHTFEILSSNFSPVPASGIPIVNNQGELQLARFGLDTIFPSLAKPMVQMGLNMNGLGLPIYREGYSNRAGGLTDAYNGRESDIGTWSEKLAVALHEATGGAIDKNPGTLRHFVNSYFAGANAVLDFGAEAVNFTQGSPLGGAFADRMLGFGGLISRPGNSDEFYQRARQLDQIHKAIKTFEEDGNTAQAERLRAKMPDNFEEIMSILNSNRRQQQQINRDMRETIRGNANSVVVKRAAIDDMKLQRRILQREANEQLDAAGV